jgi:hypothetical protein
MKRIGLIILLLTIFGGAYAEKIIIRGHPIILEKQGDVYYVPGDYKSTTTYYYVTVNGAKQVCYLEKQPTLSALNASTLEVNYNGSTLNWICYPLDVNYFQAQ